MSWELANFDVQLKPAKSSIIILPANLQYDKSIRDGRQNYTQLLKEQNHYLSNYKDFRIGGIDKDLLDGKIDEST
eukprot:2403757-Ditylum_brightwellii.AAC.1